MRYIQPSHWKIYRMHLYQSKLYERNVGLESEETERKWWNSKEKIHESSWEERNGIVVGNEIETANYEIKAWIRKRVSWVDTSVGGKC